jgi:hypothetical protein
MRLKDLTPINYNQLIENHTKLQIPLEDNCFRMLSNSWCKIFEQARHMQSQAHEFEQMDQELLETDIGTWAEYKGSRVPLDVPLTQELHWAVLTEAEYQGKQVELNKPKRGGSKKFYVYVKNPKTGNVKKISFGDTTGLSVKINDPKRRASFAARHRCEQANDKMTARYWACRLPRYKKALGLSGGGTWW